MTLAMTRDKGFSEVSDEPCNVRRFVTDAAGRSVFDRLVLPSGLSYSSVLIVLGRSWTEVGLTFSPRDPGRIRLSVPAKVVRTCHKLEPSSVLVS